jgi:hypothetical protein
MKRDHNSSSHLNHPLLLSPPPPPPPPPSSLELLLLERAKALQQHHHHQQQQQNNSKPPFPHFPPHGFRSGLFPTAPPLPANLPALLGGHEANSFANFSSNSSRPEELLQRWRQQQQLPANIQEDSRMDIVTGGGGSLSTTAAAIRASTPTTPGAEQPAALHTLSTRPGRSPSPEAAALEPSLAAVSPPVAAPPAVSPAVLNGSNNGERPPVGDEDEATVTTETAMAAEEETVTAAITAPGSLALSETGSGSPPPPSRYHDSSSPVKSEDSNLGEMLTPQQLPAMSPLSPYSGGGGLSGLPTLLSSASRLILLTVRA